MLDKSLYRGSATTITEREFSIINLVDLYMMEIALVRECSKVQIKLFCKVLVDIKSIFTLIEKLISDSRGFVF